jgi:YHS domain-containing protein
MASILIRLFFIVVLVLWMLRRPLAKLFGTSRPNQASGDSAAGTNSMVKDPVCGMYMDSRLAVRMEKRKETLYFCSEECKGKYVEHPTEETGASNSQTL